MKTRLDLNNLPYFDSSAFRYFDAHEHHVTRTFEFDVLLVVFDGVLRFRENEAPIEVAAGSYYIQRKNTLFDGKYESDMPKYYYIHFDGCCCDSDICGLPLYGKADLSALMPLFRKLERLKLTSRSKTEIYAVFYSVLQILSENSDSFTKAEPMNKLITYMVDNLAENITLDALSAKAGYCKNYIIKLFADKLGMTPRAYLTHLRLEAAENLMLGTDMTLERIGLECGFGNYINFYKAFAKKHGCSPLQFKKKAEASSRLKK